MKRINAQVFYTKRNMDYMYIPGQNGEWGKNGSVQQNI